jgi:alpha-galactosidase
MKAEEKLISIETSSLSLIFKQDASGSLRFLYFGDKLEDKESLLDKRHIRRPDTKEENIPFGYVAYGGRVSLEPALMTTHSDGSLTTELVVMGYDVRKGGDKAIHTIQLKDKHYGLFVELVFEAFGKENILTQHVKIKNEENGDIQLHNFYSFYLPVNTQSYYLTEFHGTWAREMQLTESLLTSGIRSVESKKGNRTTQSESPSFIVSLNQKAKPYDGEIIMGSLAWTGNYKLNFEVDETNQLNILAGINPFSSVYPLSTGEEFITPKMVFTYSSTGYNQASRNFHNWALAHNLNQSEEVNGIVLNSWEGAYFDFDEMKIMQMIDDAAFLGAEVFVLDDGWFGNKYPRNSDTMGLGDWQVNEKKIPNGIDYLAKYAVGKGLRFGIWIEPEMVNPKSELAENHPDWIVKSPYRDIPTLRHQWLLDLTNPEVQDFIVKTFDNVVRLSDDISYIKWDANRHVESVGSEYLPDIEQSRFWVDYINGLYSVYERIREKHPDITIQLCSSGGGRMDYKVLEYHEEFWPSDNTDPYTRIPLQFATHLFFPAKATGTHVTTIPNHQTGQSSPLKLRCDVAMMGRMGVELQPANLNENELVFLKNAINNYKKTRDIIQKGELFHIWSPYEPGDWSATGYVSKDKSGSLFFAFSLGFHERTITPFFKLKGLDPNTRYKVMELNQIETNKFPGDGKTYSGEYLMKVGVNPNIKRRGESMVLYLERVN